MEPNKATWISPETARTLIADIANKNDEIAAVSARCERLQIGIEGRDDVIVSQREELAAFSLAIRQIVNVLGPNETGCGFCGCDGCSTEMQEALRIARAALAGGDDVTRTTGDVSDVR